MRDLYGCGRLEQVVVCNRICESVERIEFASAGTNRLKGKAMQAKIQEQLFPADSDKPRLHYCPAFS